MDMEVEVTENGRVHLTEHAHQVVILVKKTKRKKQRKELVKTKQVMLKRKVTAIKFYAFL